MRIFLLSHSHDESDCETAYAAWAGSTSPLRHETAWAGCAHGDHRVFWRVSADDEEGALSLLPDFVAARTVVTTVRDVRMP